MTEADVETFAGRVDDLTEIAVREGIADSVAAACCRSLVVVTVNDAFRVVRAVRADQEPDPTTAAALSGSTSNLFRTVQWIIAGVRQQSSPRCADAAGLRANP